MKHHFADLLDRENNYWTIVPNKSRYAYTLDEEIDNIESVKIITIQKTDKNWRQVFEFPNLEEITLHSPSKEQVESISKLPHIKRLRLSHFRPRTIDFISQLKNLEEVVFEYVSGFNDLSPMQNLPRLKSLHLENLRKVSNFEGLSGINTLKYLHIDGTLDWRQPIESFGFLKYLPALEVFGLGFIKNLSKYPSFISVLELSNLKRIKIGLGTLKTEEYAFLEMALPNTICGAHGTDEWKPCWDFGEYISLLGKGVRSVRKNDPRADEKCKKHEEKYEEMKIKACEIIKKL